MRGKTNPQQRSIPDALYFYPSDRKAHSLILLYLSRDIQIKHDVSLRFTVSAKGTKPDTIKRTFLEYMAQQSVFVPLCEGVLVGYQLVESFLDIFGRVRWCGRQEN